MVGLAPTEFPEKCISPPLFTLQPNWTRSISCRSPQRLPLKTPCPLAGLAAFLLATGKAGRVSSGFPILLEAALTTPSLATPTSQSFSRTAFKRGTPRLARPRAASCAPVSPSRCLAVSCRTLLAPPLLLCALQATLRCHARAASMLRKGSDGGTSIFSSRRCLHI